MKAFSIYLTELRHNIAWHVSWMIFLISYAIWMYDLWLTFLIPFLVIGLLTYTITTGVRTSVQSISEKTGELLHTLPVSRKKMLLVRIFSSLTPIIAFFIIQFIFLSVHSFGPKGLFTQDKIDTITGWGILFGIFGLLLGVFLGLLMSNTTKGLQLAILIVLVSFVSQTVFRINANLNYLLDLVPFSYYQPNQYILYGSYAKEANIFSISFHFYPVMLVIYSFILLIVTIVIFDKKDLIDDAGLHISFFRVFLKRKIAISNVSRTNDSLVKKLLTPFRVLYHSFLNSINKVKSGFFPKNVRNNPFVFWGRIFAPKYPLMADFIYSDNILLFIGSFALFLLFPFQISHYPGNTAVEASIHSFGQTPIFSVFTYGHNLSTAPYLWFLCTNTVGIIWIIFLPLSYFWVSKAIRRDANSGYGEILGGLSLDNKQVVIQRLIAIFIELVILTIVSVFLLLFTEALNGKTYDKEWEIMAIISLLPLYIFIITFTATIALLFKNKGGIIAGIFILTIIGTFILSFLVSSLNTWYMRGLFSLYDPVQIIQKKSLLVNSYGLLVLVLLDFFSFIGLLFTASKYTWLNISEKTNVPN